MIPDEYDGGQAVLVLNGEPIPITDFNIEVEIDYTSVILMKYDQMEFTFSVQFKEQ